VTPTIGVPELLARSRRVIGPAMTAAIERLAPEIRRLVSYHMGWTDMAGNPVESPGGKGIRPTLAMLAAEAAWAEPEVGVPGGVGVELVHNFSLIHDDIIDTDAERHHRPTVWAVYGIGPAIVAGDAMQVLAHQILLESPTGRGAAASVALADATAAMIAGQADDIAFETRRDVTVEQCMAMSAAKTGALLGCAASIGAILAGAPDATVGALRDYGRHLGLAFQAVDDLLGIWGDPARTGKPAGSDLRQRKKSMPVVAALAAGGPESDELRDLIVGSAGDGSGQGDASGGAGLTEGTEPGGAAGPDWAERGAEPGGAGGPDWVELAGPGPNGAGIRLDGPAAARISNGAGSNGAGHPAGGMLTAAMTGDPRRPLDAAQIERATYLVEACGGREWTAVRAKANLDAALGALERVRLSAIPHRDLADIAVFVVERES
jgi:geranylgeranyl diphosphate synthase type I